MKKATITITYEYQIGDISELDAVYNFLRDIRNSVNEGSFKTRNDPENEKHYLVFDNGCNTETTFSYTNFDEFIVKYGKFLCKYDIVHVLQDYASAKDITCKTEEIPKTED